MRFLLSICFLFIALFSTSSVHAQLQTLTGKKHSVMCIIPEKWEQVKHPQLPFFIQPKGAEISPMTYMYVFVIDYDIKRTAKDWISVNNGYLEKEQEGIKIIKTKVSFSNLKKGNYATGKYEAVTYEYLNERKEIILAVECEESIITVVLSAKNAVEFKKLYPAFKQLTKSLIIDVAPELEEE